MRFNLAKKNLCLMAVAFAIIVLGFFLTAGAPSGETYNPDIFSFRRVTLGPMTSLFGFVFMIVAILWPNKKHEEK